MSIGTMLNLIIPHIKYFSTKDSKLITITKKDKEKWCSQKCFLQYFISIILNNTSIFLASFPSLIKQNSVEKNIDAKISFVVGSSLYESLIIILITLISFFLLKYRNYIHNHISLVSFIIMGLIIDLMINNLLQEFKGKSIGSIIIQLIVNILLVINFCYQKYMINILYYNYYNINFILGLSLFTFNTLSIPFYFFNEIQKQILSASFDNVGLLIARFLINIVLQFFFELFKILTLAYFTPNHMLICLILSKLVSTLIQSESSLKYYCIIPFAFQFFSLMVYLEIIELNFCGLNKNTKRNIQNRGDQDMLLKNISRNSTLQELVEFPGGYVVKKSNNNEKETEEDSVSEA